MQRHTIPRGRRFFGSNGGETIVSVAIVRTIETTENRGSVQMKYLARWAPKILQDKHRRSCRMGNRVYRLACSGIETCRMGRAEWDCDLVLVSQCQYSVEIFQSRKRMMNV